LKLYEIINALTPKARDVIIYGKKCGQLGRIIAKNLGCSKIAVYNTLKHLRQTGSFTPKKQTGHLLLLNIPSQQELKTFVQENGENRQLCAKKLSTIWTSHLTNPISAFTIRRILKKVGLSARISCHKPAITE
ncbi:17798_t:CDS:1, partial [Funneliformis geosporum]